MDVLHKHITQSNLSVKKSDSFDKQCILLEQSIGENTFQSTYKKMRLVNLLSGLVAFPVLLLIIAVIVYSKWINPSFDIIKWSLENIIVYTIPAALLVLTLALALLFYLFKKKLYSRIYPQLKQKIGLSD